MADDDTHNHAHNTLVLSRSVAAACGGSSSCASSNINATLESDGLSNQVQPSVEVSTADILQQAFQEASEELEQITVTYENVQNAVGIADVHNQFSGNDELSVSVTVRDSSNVDLNRVNPQNVENGISIPNVTDNVGLINRQDVNSCNSTINDKKETSPSLEITALPLGSEIQNVNSVCSDLVNQIVAVDGTTGMRLISSGDFLSTNNHNVQPYDLQSFIVAIPDVTDGLTDNISFVAPGLSESSSLVSQLPDGVSVIAQGLSENPTTESLCDVSFTTVPASSIFSTCSANSRLISTISGTTSLPLPVSTSEAFSVVTQSLSGNSQTISVVPHSSAQPLSLSVTQATLPDVGLKQIQSFPVSGGLQNVQSLALPTVTAIQQLAGHVILPLQATNAISNAIHSCSQNRAVPSTLNGTSGLIVNHTGTLTVPVTVTDSSNNFSKDVYVVDTSDNAQTVVGSTANTMSLAIRPSVTTKPNVQKLTVASKLDSCQSLNPSVKIVQGLNQTAAQASLQPKSKTAPLGSSENPIQIIQQGNTYHSTQVLTQEQLQQIAHVLQQQQISKSSESGSSSVLYNPATNTRIIYRVIYPSELQTKSSSKKDGSIRGGIKRGRGRPRKIWSVKKVTQDEPDDETHGQEISQEEKELKKKHRPRTRSGRISKPPSYMVQDYKRIHHLDFNEDPHDDTDGGYSDFQMSDEESENMHQGPKYLPPGVNTVRPRTHKCSSCDKAYIGQGGLARHYRQYPSHGKLPNPEENSVYEDENSNTSAISNSTTSTGQIASVIDSAKEATVSEKIDGTSKTDPDISSKNLCGSASTENQTANSEPIEKPRRRVNVAKIRRQNKLKDVLRHCTDEDLLEVVLPRLAGVVSLWEFLLKKFQLEDANELEITDMFDQLTTLMTRVRALAQDCLTQTSGDSSEESSRSTVKIHSEELAELLGISTGVYQTKPWKKPHQAEVPAEPQSFTEPSDSHCSKETGAEATEFTLDLCKSGGDNDAVLDSIYVVNSKNTLSLQVPVKTNDASEKHITVCPSDSPSTSVFYSDPKCDISLFEKSNKSIEQYCRPRSSPPPKKRCLEDSLQIVISTDLPKSISSTCSLPSQILTDEGINSDAPDNSNKYIRNATSKTDISSVETISDSAGKNKIESGEIHSHLTDLNIGLQNTTRTSTPSSQTQYMTSVTGNGQQSDKLTTFANIAEQLSTISVKNVQLPSEVNRILSSEAPVSKGNNYSKQGPEPQENSVQESKVHNYFRISNNNIVVVSSSATNSHNISSVEQHPTGAGHYAEKQGNIKNCDYQKEITIHGSNVIDNRHQKMIQEVSSRGEQYNEISRNEMSSDSHQQKTECNGVQHQETSIGESSSDGKYGGPTENDDSLQESPQQMDTCSYLHQEVNNTFDYQHQELSLINTETSAAKTGTESSLKVNSTRASIETGQTIQFEEMDTSGKSSLTVSREQASVVRHVMLPDGQLIEALDINESGVGEHQMLPGNVVIVQNSDGTTTLQIPSDQTVPLETLQALLAMDQNLSEFFGGSLEQQLQSS